MCHSRSKEVNPSLSHRYLLKTCGLLIVQEDVSLALSHTPSHTPTLSLGHPHTHTRSLSHTQSATQLLAMDGLAKVTHMAILTDEEREAHTVVAGEGGGVQSARGGGGDRMSLRLAPSELATPKP